MCYCCIVVLSTDLCVYCCGSKTVLVNFMPLYSLVNQIPPRTPFCKLEGGEGSGSRDQPLYADCYRCLPLVCNIYNGRYVVL